MNRYLVATGILIILLTTARVGKATDDKTLTVCIVEPSTVQEGEPAIIICKFPKDLSSGDTAVEVHQRIGNSSEEPSERVLHYSVTDASPVYTYYRNGFFIVGKVQREMRILINSVSIEHAGNYSCKLIPTGKEVTWCTLKVIPKIPNTQCRVQQVSLGENASLVCQFNVNILQGHRQIIVQRQSESGVFLARSVTCFTGTNQAKAQHYTCSSKLNDCPVDQNDTGIFCEYNNAEYYVDETRVTSSTLTVLVLHQPRKAEGYYACKLGSAAEQEVSDCHLAAKEPAFTTENPGYTVSSDNGTVRDIAISSFVLSLVFPVIILACVVYKKRSRVIDYIRRLIRRTEEGGTEQSSPAPPSAAATPTVQDQEDETSEHPEAGPFIEKSDEGSGH